MSHPDPRVAEALERTAAEMATATTAPPPELTDDPAAYMEWLRTRPAPDPRASQRPRGHRSYLDRAKIPRKWGTGGERLTQPSVHPAPGTVPARPDGYDAAVAKLRRLADFGAASLEAARAELGDGTPYPELVLHAATHPVAPPTKADDQAPAGLVAEAPVCDTCGTLLDPDGCWTCSSSITNTKAKSA